MKQFFLLTVLFLLQQTIYADNTNIFIKKCLVEIDKTPSEIPKSVRIAQAILESDRGKSNVCKKTNNYFGLRIPVYKTTFKKVKGKTIKRKKFVKYTYETFSSMGECFKAHVKRLKTNKIYKSCFQTKNPAEAARRLQKAGYCPEKDYAIKLIGLINRYNLKKYDNN